MELAEKQYLVYYSTFFICNESNSTGVSLPNMLTKTLIFPLSLSISETLPSNPLNGPSTTLTVAPTSKSMKRLLLLFKKAGKIFDQQRF